MLGDLTLAADIDVVEIERFKGFNDESRFVNFGLEFDTLGWLQLRAGYQNDLEDTVEDLFSAGLGISPFNTVHIDLSGVYGEGDTYGGGRPALVYVLERAGGPPPAPASRGI